MVSVRRSSRHTQPHLKKEKQDASRVVEPRRSPWFEDMAELVAAYEARNWQHVEEIIAEAKTNAGMARRITSLAAHHN